MKAILESNMERLGIIMRELKSRRLDNDWKYYEELKEMEKNLHYIYEDMEVLVKDIK